jgi:hypothetical protein
MTIILTLILIVIGLMIFFNFTDSNNYSYSNSNFGNNQKAINKPIKTFDKEDLIKLIRRSYNESVRNSNKTISERMKTGDNDILAYFGDIALNITYKTLKKELINNSLLVKYISNNEIEKILINEKDKIYNLYFESNIIKKNEIRFNKIKFIEKVSIIYDDTILKSNNYVINRLNDADYDVLSFYAQDALNNVYKKIYNEFINDNDIMNNLSTLELNNILTSEKQKAYFKHFIV